MFVRLLCCCVVILIIGRPTDLSADLSFTANRSFFFFRPLPSEHRERNSTKTGHMLRSVCGLKMHLRNVGYPLPLQIGGQKTLFRQLRNTIYIIGQVR